MVIDNWAQRWGISKTAIAELRYMIGLDTDSVQRVNVGASESVNLQKVRLAACEHGIRLWRNNVGVLPNEAGVPIRFGLANDSPAVNKRLKSSDCIGITPYVVKAGDIGNTVGIFTSIEVKRDGWSYSGKGREPAQLAWIELVLLMGGIAKFSTGEL